MKAALITMDSVRHDSIPQWFIDKWRPKIYTSMRTYYAGTIPSLTSFYTGLPPQWHGVEDHHIFFKFYLNAETIFDVLSRFGVKAVFSSDEWLMYNIQAVANAERLFDDKEKPTFDENTWINHLSVENTFIAIHYFHDTHAPYRDESIRKSIIRKGKRGWLNKEFMVRCKTAQTFGIDSAMRSIDRLLTATRVNAIISSDHGEAFGEEGLYGHDRLFIEPVVRIPFLVVTPRKVSETIEYVNEELYQSVTWPLIMKWFDIKANPQIIGSGKYIPPSVADSTLEDMAGGVLKDGET